MGRNFLMKLVSWTMISKQFPARLFILKIRRVDTDRIERYESLIQWRNRLDSARFSPVHLGSNAFKQAGMLLAMFAGGDGYNVEENNGV
ncbi:hypothetical protein V6N12_010768 [Hibiscus sabdariffa]|uniref:Uncharacterized protein n=1 Tax=Hibiscus sabdariffa TaxID=183260 RepID=A0ABR2ENJ2_9ROSI